MVNHTVEYYAVMEKSKDAFITLAWDDLRGIAIKAV